MKIFAASLALLLLTSSVSGFIANDPKNALHPLHVTSGTPPEVLADYLAKAHEAKLKAVQEAEKAKDVEIEALKKEIADLKGSRSSPLITSNNRLIEGSKEELAEKLLSYQNFMAKYIVESQLEKAKATQAVEEATIKKYEMKLQMLSGASAEEETKDIVSVAAFPESDLYTKRSQRVTEAAKAGKSRWGDMENTRAAEIVSAQTDTKVSPTTITASNPGTTNVAAKIVNEAFNGKPVPPEVEAADHGLRADGGVGGYTLGDRVAYGIDVVKTNGRKGTHSTEQSLYQKRNVMVVAAANAGKSRWGSMEVERAMSLSSALSLVGVVAAQSSPVIPEVAAADHGLRADGGVGGPTLAERVNLGAQLLGTD